MPDDDRTQIRIQLRVEDADVEAEEKPANTSNFQVLLCVIAVAAAPPAKSIVEKNTSEFLCKFKEGIYFLLNPLICKLR